MNLTDFMLWQVTERQKLYYFDCVEGIGVAPFLHVPKKKKKKIKSESSTALLYISSLAHISMPNDKMETKKTKSSMDWNFSYLMEEKVTVHNL